MQEGGASGLQKGSARATQDSSFPALRLLDSCVAP